VSTGSTEERQPEIIIVRRGGDDEDEGHHGGVWKIAFADFMTAMMCFFLVMWLINAANEQTRVALASYFNPVKLIDRNTNRKGLDDIGQGPQYSTEPKDAERSTETPAGRPDTSPAPADFQGRRSDESFFANPYAVLAEIAAETGRDQNISDRGEGGQQIAGPSSGASGGEAYRDPFAPDFWSQQVAVPGVGIEGDPKNTAEARVPPGPAAAETSGDDVTAVALAPVPQAEPLATAEGSEEATRQEAPTAEKAEAPEVPPAEEAAATNAAPDARKIEANETAADDLRTAIAEALRGEGLAASVTVSASEQGVLISVTDDIRSGMFTVGSAVPERALVLAMEKIGRTLAERPGSIRVHGHTDARPYRGNAYDNWRLSTARAHAAQYMLVRGGVDEARITEVAGFADRRLKLPDDPLADANRRIEILLEVRQ
jgi:chemotaxis protein MotB